jgi:membrane associated rhomboid family serine protease
VTMDFPTTYGLLAVTVLVSMLALGNEKLMAALILWPPAVTRDRDVHRLATYGLVHADGAHLLFNMITLYFFGTAMERFFDRELGNLGFLFFYVSALVASAIPSYLKHRDDPDYRTLGASGAVSAVLFAFILLDPWSKLYLYFAIPIPALLFAVCYTAYSIYMNHRGGDRINHNAHLAGAAYGVVFTLVVDPAVGGRFLDKVFG